MAGCCCCCCCVSDRLWVEFQSVGDKKNKSCDVLTRPKLKWGAVKPNILHPRCHTSSMNTDKEKKRGWKAPPGVSVDSGGAGGLVSGIYGRKGGQLSHSWTQRHCCVQSFGVSSCCALNWSKPAWIHLTAAAENSWTEDRQPARKVIKC